MYSFLSFLISLNLSGFLQDQPEPVKGDSLESVFYLGSTDLFWQSGYQYASLDRMSFQLNSGRYGYYGPQPEFMLNDIPFNLTFFGTTFSQFIPEPYSRIEEIRVNKGSGVYRGTGYSSGLIEIKPEPMKEGLSLFVSGQYGHNSGEPGPWGFDPNRVTPNVERFGPWVDAGIGLKISGWYARGTLRTHSNKNLDEFVQTRIINLRELSAENEFLSVENTATLGLIETGFESERMDFRAQAMQAESTDFLYFHPLTREIATRLHSDQYSVFGRIVIQENSGIRLLYQYREKKTEYRRNRFGQSFDWNQKKQIFRGSYYYEGNRASTEAGAQNQIIEANAPRLNDGTFNQTKAFVEQWLNVNKSIKIGTVQKAEFKEDDIALQSFGTIRLKPGSRWTTEFEGGYSELFSITANPIDYWVGRGYGIYDRLRLNYQVPDQISNTRKSTFSNRHIFNVSDQFQMEAELEWIHHYSINIPFQKAQYDLPFSTMPGLYTLHGGESGSRYQLRFAANHTLSEIFNQGVVVWFNRTANGNENYRQYWRTIPEILVQYEAGYRPYSDIAINLRLQYRSETEWAEFENLDGELNRSFHAQYPFKYFHFSNRLPEHVRLDLSASKWFWEQRLRLALTLKNIFGENFQSHPIGTREGFGYYVRLDMRF